MVGRWADVVFTDTVGPLPKYPSGDWQLLSRSRLARHRLVRPKRPWGYLTKGRNGHKSPIQYNNYVTLPRIRANMYCIGAVSDNSTDSVISVTLMGSKYPGT